MNRSLRDLSLRPISVLKTVSARKAAQLEGWGVETVLDLLMTFPRRGRYIDRTNQSSVSGLDIGEAAAVLATVVRTRSVATRNRRAMVTITVRDESGAMELVFFNQPWRAKQLREGTEAIFWGKVGEYKGTRQMVNPVVDVVAGVEESGVGTTRKTLRILPVYPASAKAGLTSWEIGTFVEEALERAGDFLDPLPEEWRTALELWDRTDAFRAIHAPESMEVIGPARRRLVFDELFRLQLALVLRRRAFEDNARALRHDVSPLEVTGAPTDTLVSRFLSGLPYALTTAQRRALAVIVADLAGPFPMHRLLQGDVGSGKTVVALAALLGAVQSGHQGALMVPTEVLAEQHYTAVRALLGDLDVKVALLTSRVKGKARTKMLAELASGEIQIAVGTHALLTEEVAFASLGLVVIDEQHRFGVEQRATLRAKGTEGDPDLLVMTATPIPRTAAMVIFGDLDETVLDEMPPGRIAIKTTWLPQPADEHLAWERVRSEVAAGHRAFVVCPLVGESLRVEARSAEEEFERLAAGELAGLSVGLLHGQMAPAAREEAMARFRTGELEVLVATTVIEVGVDVPEATVMVIESADRFGIAQLHQLRGRVGRGALPSWCFLLGGLDESERLAAVEKSTDGFVLAEEDLRLRGEGTLLGSRQKGQSDLRLASLSDPEDRALLTEARRVAEAVSIDEALEDEIRLFLSEDEGEYLFKS
ncbi:MAG TPA: ATP-dependent DNA helicase RecG [Acidimicrobiales bacterium]|nr:ATP-dependent DNA helicase RecG [Acidimicrobiales bacterium]